MTKKVDGAFIRANEAHTNDWPSHGLDGMKIKAFIQGTADAIRPRK